MTDQCAELRSLYQEVPVYGYGSTYHDLRRVYLKAQSIILGIVAKKEFLHMQQVLGVSSVEIDDAIRGAGKAKTKKGQKAFFEQASEQLQEDIKTVMGLIGCK